MRDVGGKIALGVFLGNLAFGVLVWIAVAMVADNARTNALVSGADAEYSTMAGHDQRVQPPRR